MSAPSAAKRQKSSQYVPYHLVYWPGIPGRGEHVRLALEEAGAEYTDTAFADKGIGEVLAAIDTKNIGNDVNPPSLAPPMLRHGDVLIGQTPNILLYLGRKLGLTPPEDQDENGIYIVNGLALTALDGLSNEVHDCHHPIANELYYEDQKEESLRKSRSYVKNRLPKFLGYFERVLQGPSSGQGPWLYGGQLTYADLVLFQCLDGTKHQFPRAVKKLQESGGYERVFALYDAVRERPKIKAYLESDRRQKYNLGIYRYYEELDVVDE